MALSITSFWRRPTDHLAQAFLAERKHWPFWLPVLLAVGVASYFSPPVEPPWYVGPVRTGVLIIAASTLRYVLLVLLALQAMALSFCADQDRGTCVASPIQTARLGSINLTSAIAVR